ncbi:MAG TPA: LpqN/LpqT family lipoprotein, partial [Mycobacterium sp.]|nr:LpqN/LpqT family lipoprotein [Mycobacterium sp.]
MRDKTRTRLTVAGAVSVGLAVVLSFSGGNAGAQPVLPVPPPAPVTVTQTVTVVPTVAAPPPVAAPPAVTAAPLTPVAQTAPPAVPGPVAAAPAAEPAVVPATSGSLSDYFKSKGVTLVAQRPQGFRAVSITLPMPTRWSPVPDPNVPDAFVVIADRAGGDGLYTPNAQVVVYKLIGDFDPREAIAHGFIDSQSLM